MNRTLFLLAFLAASSLQKVESRPQWDSEIEEQKVRLVEQEEARIWVSKPDPAAISKIDEVLADDFVCVCDGVEVTKKQALADFVSGDSKIDLLKDGPMKVRFFDGVAVVTGSDDRHGSYKGVTYSGHYVWTDVLVKRKGKWLEVVAHMNRVSPS
jgi:Domain of unknown function (DUF4440)